ncbi:MAG: OmpA family protein, partial [Proteobacteria bacterium]|nr:OmpA family protein [Pseudomonadota bacterium]
GTTDLMVMLRPEEVLIDTESKQIFLHRKVFFEIDKAELKLESLHVLDSLVLTLGEHPEITKLRIDGHTDITGSDEHNQKLSEARAASVVAYLVREGIAQDRLVSKGFGETKVLQKGESDDVHATNRRVEFHILEM